MFLFRLDDRKLLTTASYPHSRMLSPLTYGGAKLPRTVPPVNEGLADRGHGDLPGRQERDPLNGASPPVGGIMGRTKTAVFAIGGMLVLGACGPQSTTSSADPPTPAASAAPSSAPSITTEGTPGVKRRIVTETRVIPFTTRKVKDATLARGTTKVRTQGRTGVRALTYEVTLVNGRQTDKRLIRVIVRRAPVTRVVAVGTRSTRRCDPNYSGACVPIASDVDCAGGGGNGPAYVQGRVRVVGTDIYDLDRDGDGIACDS